jgi:hypothetical protein
MKSLDFQEGLIIPARRQILSAEACTPISRDDVFDC